MALAFVLVPVVVFWAGLVEASAFAQHGVPVVAIQEARVWRALPNAGVRVQDVVGVLLPHADVRVEFRSAFALA